MATKYQPLSVWIISKRLRMDARRNGF